MPTEAEWEYAARAGTTTAFYNGPITAETGSDANAEQIAWYAGNAGGESHDVGTRSPNALGLYDMSGNAKEWVWDWYGNPSEVSAAVNPVGPQTSTERALRGGSWSSQPAFLRAASRESSAPGLRDPEIGFRLARTIAPDSDGDGLPDSQESTLGTNPLDPDTDADGILDGADLCPNTVDPLQLDTDGDGLGNACDLDDDSDGEPDASDNCPLVFNPAQTDEDQDGYGASCDCSDIDPDIGPC